jgi:hypothetical protein
LPNGARSAMMDAHFNVARGNLMIKTKYGIVILATTALAISVGANTDWHNPDDIPVIEPVTVGLAGEQPADIVRFLDEGHGIEKQANRVAYYRNMASFLEQHLQPNEEDTTD